MEWIYLEVAEESVKPVTEDIWFDELKSEGYSMEKEHHITLVPGYKSDKIPQIPDFSEPQPIEVSGFRFWPDIENPMVVMLDVSDDMLVNLWRDDILEQIGRSSVEYDVAPPHVTLFKAGDNGDETSFSIDPETRNRLVDTVGEKQPPSKVIVTDIVRSSWEI